MRPPISKVVRIRGRNQVTVPAQIAERLNLREDDLLAVSLDEAGVITLRPTRLVTAGSSEAEQEERRAEADLRAGRSRVFDSPEEYARQLLERNREQQAERSAAGESSPAGQPEAAAGAARVSRVGVPVDAFEPIRKFRRQPSGGEAPAMFCLVHMGARATSLSIWQGAIPVLTRAIEIGAEDYAAALGREQGIPADEAERMKDERLAPVVSERIARVFDSVSSKLAEEVRATLDAARGKMPGVNVQGIFLSVGPPTIRGLAAKLEETIGVPVRELKALAEVLAETHAEQPPLFEDVARGLEFPPIERRYSDYEK
jgi:AbrB family looped-hinge helix DNA binding protein